DPGSRRRDGGGVTKQAFSNQHSAISEDRGKQAMSDILVLEQPAAKKTTEKKKAGKVRDVLRVLRDGRWLGGVLLDRKGGVWRHVDSVPADVVLKSVAAFVRGDERGEMVGRRDGLAYSWHLVVEQPAAVETEVGTEMAEAA